MGRVSWDRLAPEDFEQIVAVLLHSGVDPRARRMRAAQGDDGVDVLVPIDADSERVFQVKAFHSRLDSDRKRKIRGSLDRAISTRGARLKRWSLVVGFDHSPAEERWFRELTADQPFDSDWIGLTALETLAAKYQHVIDYYLGDGRAQLETQLRDLRTIGGVLELAGTPGAVIRPGDLSTTLHELGRSINTADPHFRYDLHIGHTEPDERDRLRHPGAIASWSSWDGSTSVTVAISTRYDAALLDRPMPIELEVDVAPGSQLATDVENFRNYGTPVKFPSTALRGLHLDLPGGLKLPPGQLSEVRLSSRARADDRPMVLDVGIVAADGARRHLLFQERERSVGAGPRPGLRIAATDLTGMVELVISMKPQGGSVAGQFNISIAPAIGFAVRAVREVMEFARTIEGGGTLEVGLVAHRPLLGLPASPGMIGDAAEMALTIEIASDLIVLESLSVEPLYFPDGLRPETIGGIRDAANLIRDGRLALPWSRLELVVKPEGEHLIRRLQVAPHQVLVEGDYSVDIGQGRMLEIGRARQLIARARLDGSPEVLPDGQLRCVLVPAADDGVLEISLIPAES